MKKEAVKILELLAKAGVVEKKYDFTCPACGATCMTISGNDLKGYLRVWELLKMVPLSSAQIVEYDDLCAKGFCYIGLLCLNKKCTEGIDTTINSMDELRAYKNTLMLFIV